MWSRSRGRLNWPSYGCSDSTFLTSLLHPWDLPDMTTAPAPYAFRPGADSPYRKLPVVGPLLDDLLAWLRSRGYSELSIRNHVIRTARLCRWLQRRIGRAFSDLSQSDLRAASDYFRGRRGEVAGVIPVLRRFLAERRRLPPEPA